MMTRLPASSLCTLALAYAAGCSAQEGGGAAMPEGGAPHDLLDETMDEGDVSRAWERSYEGTQGSACAHEDEAEFAHLSSVSVGETTLYAGFEQVSGNNQDPIFVKFQGGVKQYCVYHEEDGPDGRAHALTWDGGAFAYVVYTIVGGGTGLEKRGGWLDSFAPGRLHGGNKNVSVLARVNVESGQVESASFFMAVLSSGEVNSHGPVDKELNLPPVAVLNDGHVQFMGSSAHKPIDADGTSSMECTDYPFTSRYVLSADLSTLHCAESTNCTSQKPCD